MNTVITSLLRDRSEWQGKYLGQTDVLLAVDGQMQCIVSLNLAMYS